MVEQLWPKNGTFVYKFIALDLGFQVYLTNCELSKYLMIRGKKITAFVIVIVTFRYIKNRFEELKVLDLHEICITLLRLTARG